MFMPDLSPLFTLAIIGIACIFLAIAFGIFKGVTALTKHETVIESKVIVVPDYRLSAKGKNIDTVYIYRFKR